MILLHGLYQKFSPLNEIGSQIKNLIFLFKYIQRILQQNIKGTMYIFEKEIKIKSFFLLLYDIETILTELYINWLHSIHFLISVAHIIIQKDERMFTE